MKTTGFRSLILYIFGIGFFVGLGIFLYGLATKGGSWAVQPFNRHVTGESVSTGEGNILDRKGVVLAESKNGRRVYGGDETTRRAMLHTVGDTQGYISAGVQHNYRAELSGYNLITGLTSPTGKPNGSNISLTLDSGLCRLAREKLGNRDGAAAVYNYKTGEILCMVSTPDYDPQNPPADLNTDKTGKYSGVYLNKVLSSTFTPGSTFKVITSAAAIENIPDLDNRTWNCNGSVTINGNKITDMYSYGRLSFKNAFAKSSNVAFSQIAVEIGADKMAATADKMGFNRSFSIDGIPTATSVYNVKGAQSNELGWSGVGQYTDLANPCHMMILMGAVANGGTPVLPYFIKNITTKYGLVSRQGSAKTGDEMLNPDTAVRLTQYMRYNVTYEYGDSLFPGLAVCAKTGTAQVHGKGDNCWMVGFSSNPNSPLAFAVIVENSYSGSIASAAGRIASALMTEAAKIK